MKRFILFLAFICCALSISAQNMRRIEGEVKNHLGVSIPNATLQVYGVDKVYSTDANGKFSIDVPIQAFAITVFSEGYKAKFMEIDGTYMLFILRPDFAKEKKERLLAEKEVVAKAKAEAERKASEEKARLVAEQETVRIATEKAKAEEKAKITAQKEAEEKVKAEEKVRITAQKEAKAIKRREKGYNQFIDLSYSYCGVTDFLGVNYIGGYRFNPYLFLGLGTGVNISLLALDTSKLNQTVLRPTTVNIPVYLYFKANFTKHIWSPYISVSAGARLSPTIQKGEFYTYNQSGFLGDVIFGVDRAISKKSTLYFGVGYRVESYLYPKFDSNDNLIESHKLSHGVSLHVGLSF